LRFLWHRVLRIYPALIIAIVFCVFVIGLTFTKLSAHAYLSNANIYTYLWKNSFLFFGYERYLPAVFIDIPYGRAVNSSLWTLPWEVRMYALLFLLACTQYYLKLLNRVWLERIIIIIAVISMPTYLCDRFLPFISDINLKNGLRLQALFFAGATAFILRDFINLSMKLALTILAGLVALAFFYAEAFYPLYFICLPWLVLVFAYIPTGKIRLFNGVGDYSYGIYIYAFPIQQATMSLMRGLSVYELTLIALIVSLCFAAASWHLIEKPMLAKKNLQL
jgi:peptidoglycan/LPS O-acetylase OafA/YrhL